MIYKNTPRLKQYLEDAGFRKLASQPEFDLEDAQYSSHLRAAHESPREHHPDIAAFCCLTWHKRPDVVTVKDAPLDVMPQIHTEIQKGHAVIDALSQQADQLQQIINTKALELTSEGERNKQDADTQIALTGIRDCLKDNIAQLGSAMDQLALRLTQQFHQMIGVVSDSTVPRTLNRIRWSSVITNIILLLILLLLITGRAHAQNTDQALVVATCGTAPGNWPGSGNRAPVTVDVNGNLCAGVTVNVSGAADTVGTTAALGAANATASIALAGQQGVNVTFASGNLVGTVGLKVSLDGGTTYDNSNGGFFSDLDGHIIGVSLTNPSNARYGITVPVAATNVEVIVSAYTSGTVNATLRATANSGYLGNISQGFGPANGQAPNGAVMMAGLNGSSLTDLDVDGSGNLLIAQGPASTSGAGGAWYVFPTDGVNVPTVKGASTAAVAADKAQVVAISPNNSVGTVPSSNATTGSAWNSSTTLNTTQTFYTMTANSLNNNGIPQGVSVSLVQTTSITAGAINFQVEYDTSGSNWTAIPSDQVIDPTSTSYATVPVAYALQANTTKTFYVLTKGAVGLRIILSTAITGTGAVTPYWTLVYNTAGIQPVITQAGSTITAVQPIGTNLHEVVDSGTITISGNVTNVQPTASNLNAQVQGNVANGATDSGNPVKIGGAYNTTLPTLTNGQRGDAQMNASGIIYVDASKTPATGPQVASASSAVVCATDQFCKTNTTQIANTNVLTGAGASGAGSQRVTVAQDTTTIAGSAPGTAGTASANVISVQGIASMTPVQITGTLSDNGAAATTNRAGVLPAIAQSQIQAGATAGRDVAAQTDLNRSLMVAQAPLGITTYVAAGSGTLATNPTDIWTLSGNATNTVWLTQVEMTCTETTAGIVDVYLDQHSAADSGGTSTTLTNVKFDTNDGNAVSAALFYTANPTVGTIVGSFDHQKIGFNAPGGTNEDVYLWTAAKYGRPIVLRGTAQQAALSLKSAALTGSACAVMATWMEVSNSN